MSPLMSTPEDRSLTFERWPLLALIGVVGGVPVPPPLMPENASIMQILTYSTGYMARPRSISHSLQSKTISLFSASCLILGSRSDGSR